MVVVHGTDALKQGGKKQGFLFDPQNNNITNVAVAYSALHFSFIYYFIFVFLFIYIYTFSFITLER